MHWMRSPGRRGRASIHCVDVCPHEALRFGDEEDFADEIAKAEAIVPERAASDEPRMYYLNLPKRFIGGIIVDLEADEVIIGAKINTRESRFRRNQ